MRYLIVLILFLPGCATTGVVSDPASVATAENQALYASWLVTSRDDIAAHVIRNLQKNIKAFAPEAVQGFPRARVSVSLANDTLYGDRLSLQEALGRIFQRVWDEVFASTKSGNEIDVRVTVTFFNPKLNVVAGSAVAIPNAAVCFSSLFVVCPSKSTQVVRLDIDFLSEGQPPFSVQGTGGAYTLLSTGVIEDNDERAYELAKERGIKALTAAIADAVKNAKASGYGEG